MNIRVVGTIVFLSALAGCGSAERERTSGASSGALDVRLERDGIAFRVTCPNEGSLNTLKVSPSGLEIVNDPVVAEIDGTARRAEVADLDGDGSPEVYVFVTSAGSGSYGTVVGWAANRRRSLSSIHMPAPAPDAPEFAGYMGHDAFTLEETKLVRSFPVYREGDPNAAPGGGSRRLAYALVPGEAGWLLVLTGESVD